MNELNYYEILEIPRNASQDQIRKAFLEKAPLLHPDVNKSDPQAAEKYKQLTQAYHLLLDEQRRKKYDDSLPVEPIRITDPSIIWKIAGERFFEQSERFTPAVDAMRVSSGLGFEGESLLIVGIPPAKSTLISYIEAAATHNTVKRIISDLYGKSLDFRVFSGSTMKDWENQRAAEEKIQKRRMGGMANLKIAKSPAVTEATVTAGDTEDIWEELMERMMREWTENAARSYPQFKARFVLEQLPALSRAIDASLARNVTEEGCQRDLARAIDRLASLTGIESGVVALEYLRCRARMTGGL